MFDIWIYVEQRDDEIEEATYGLVTEARRLIVETTLSLKEISDKVGIQDYYYFLRVFKKIQGITPGSLRKIPAPH